ncbi:hypothetical protein [Negadavirga shengliensis]|uniref:PKD domain-containing protein n=1 Tax=Negadavirga shengliensis TaxID=1389218 RepID=A0ABV9T7V8_9BACT
MEFAKFNTRKMLFLWRIMIFVFSLVGMAGLAHSQNQPHLDDLRDCGKSCTGSNYTIEKVYLSDVNGNPITNQLLTCTPGVEQTTYITLEYKTNSTSDVHNGRLLANLKIGDEVQFLNYYFGNIPSATTASKKLTLSQFPMNWTCGEKVTLENPMIAWTTSSSKNLSSSYTCEDYPGGQCQFPSNIVVDAPLAVQFTYDEPLCPVDGTALVEFTSTTNGGREPYSYEWTFINATIENSTSPNPSVDFYPGSGSATLEVTDGNGTVNTYSVDFDVPEEIDVQGTATHSTDEENHNGSIDLDVYSSGTHFFSWTGPDGFTSDQQNLSGLSPGIYEVTVTNGDCSKTLEFEIMYLNPLPISWDKTGARFEPGKMAVTISWSTHKEWESGHFEIERTIDPGNFESVGQVQSAGWSEEITYYQFEDRNLPRNGGKLYYRIKEVGLNGAAMVSETMRVDIPPLPFQREWAVFPNPFKEKSLFLKYLGDARLSGERVYIRIYSASAAHHGYFALEGNLVDLSSTVSLFPKGLVFIEIKYQNRTEIIKLMHQ